MFEIITLIYQICQFQKGPQDMPYSASLLKLLILIDFAISFLMFNMETGGIKALFQALTGVLLVLALSWLTIKLAGKPERFNQTASALVGADAMISFFALPATAAMMTGFSPALVFFTLIGLMIWHWAITGHIIRHTMNQHWIFGLGLALLYLLASYQIMAWLFPELTAN